MKKFDYVVNVEFAGSIDGKDEAEAREKLKQSFLDEFDIELDDGEIQIEVELELPKFITCIQCGYRSYDDEVIEHFVRNEHLDYRCGACLDYLDWVKNHKGED